MPSMIISATPLVTDAPNSKAVCVSIGNICIAILFCPLNFIKEIFISMLMVVSFSSSSLSFTLILQSMLYLKPVMA